MKNSKSAGSDTVWVRVPPSAPNKNSTLTGCCFCLVMLSEGLEAALRNRCSASILAAGERCCEAARGGDQAAREQRVESHLKRLPTGCCFCLVMLSEGLEAALRNRCSASILAAGERCCEAARGGVQADRKQRVESHLLKRHPQRGAVFVWSCFRRDSKPRKEIDPVDRF